MIENQKKGRPLLCSSIRNSVADIMKSFSNFSVQQEKICVPCWSLLLMNYMHATKLLSVRMHWKFCARTGWSAACMATVIFQKTIKKN
ncbi:hypothetical protein H206_05142 [Candidatus Electrothrix aarhusensis]|uniref:Uncharacterized protein n=1 Tax=Candidatus Electrothrix aarhusensis TaxID=1859131 RepID=A0A3S4TDP4_9BACT|nr:hypothetical protein H206_05142 [Candidatus Electrothrix aarhusensis]